jgi:hypothetical protein
MWDPFIASNWTAVEASGANGSKPVAAPFRQADAPALGWSHGATIVTA